MLNRMGRCVAVESPALVVGGLFATLALLGLGHFVTADTWLALVSGRTVWADGPPSEDVLTAWTAGREWVDQQWLGQLLLYGAWRTGGLELTALLHAIVLILSFAAVIALARRRGGSAPSVATVGLISVVPILIVGGNIRTQTFAIPLFVAVLWLLSRDSRDTSLRVFLALPLLVLWANVHGSVLVGVGLVGLAGILQLPGRRGWALVLLAPCTLLATPYGFDIFSYFGDLLGNGEISSVAGEWMAPSLEPANVPLFLLAALTTGLLARTRQVLTRFEQLVLVFLLIAALVTIRNFAWFSLTALVLLPTLVTQSRSSTVGDDDSSPGLALVLAGVIGGGVIAAGIAGVLNLDGVVEERFPPEVADTVGLVATQDPRTELYVDPSYADWLLFRLPQLEGRVPFDIRYELLSESELRRYRRFRHQIGEDWRRAAGAATLYVLDRTDEPLDSLSSTADVLLRDPGAERVIGRHDVVVVRTRPPEATQRP